MRLRCVIYLQLIVLAAVLAGANTYANAKTAKAGPASVTEVSQKTKLALPSAAGLIQKIREKNGTIQNYSYKIHRFDLADQFVLRRNDDALKSYKAILDKLNLMNKPKPGDTTGEAEYKEAIATVVFVKPFSLQFNIEKSDFVPIFLQRAKIIYRPEINNEEIFLKEPYLGLMIGTDAAGESGTVMISNWTYELMEIGCELANGGKAKVAGTEMYGGKPAYKLEVTLKKGEIPWAVGCGGEVKDIPKNAYTQVSREMQMMADRMDDNKKERGTARYWIDADTQLIVKKEVVFGKTAAIKYEITDIKLNGVKPADMEMVKKK
jgi:hypothetical protein